jgi:hypothetical protein
VANGNIVTSHIILRTACSCIMKSKASGLLVHGQKQSGPGTYRTTAGVWGARTYALAWHATGHKVNSIRIEFVPCIHLAKHIGCICAFQPMIWTVRGGHANYRELMFSGFWQSHHLEINRY